MPAGETPGVAAAVAFAGIMAPLADFAGTGREIVIIAYQAGNAVVCLLAPTVGLLMGVLTMTKTSFGVWLKFIWKFMVFIVIVTCIVLGVASTMCG